MSIVDDQCGVVGAGQRRDLSQRRDVTIHGKHALGEDELWTAIPLILSHKLGEMSGVAMPVSDLMHVRRLAAKMHAGVIETVGEDQRLGPEYALIKECLKHRRIGLKPGRHEQRSRLLLERRHLGLDAFEEVEIAGDQARCARARAVVPGPFRRPGDERLMKAQGQIIVARQIDVCPTAGQEGARIASLDHTQLPPQMVLAEGIEKGLVPGFASNHDPVLAKGLILSNQIAWKPCQKPWKA